MNNHDMRNFNLLMYSRQKVLDPRLSYGGEVNQRRKNVSLHLLSLADLIETL